MLTMTFSSTQVLLGTAMLLLLLFGVGWWGKHYFKMQGEASTDAEASRTKYHRVDVFRFQSLFLRLGLVCSLAFVFLAFNFTQFDYAANFISMGAIDEDPWVENAPPITNHPPPPPPPPKFTAVDDSVVPDTVIFQSMDITDTTTIAPPVLQPPKPAASPLPPPPRIIEDEPDIWVAVEEMPTFGDCQNEASKTLRRQCSDRALIEYISKKVRYPAIARENGVNGTAVIRFVVEKDGSLSGIEIVRDPGAGLGAEAERVVQLMADTGPKWTPGRQTGRAVRVQFNLPVRFKLE